MGMYVSMDGMYTGDGSGAGAGFGVGDPPAAARVVAYICGREIFSIVAGTLQIFRVGSHPFVSLLK